MFQELEQINPFDKNYKDLWIKIEHLGRYLFVKDFIKSHLKNPFILDVACGSGYGTEILSEVCDEIIAIDNNIEILDYLNEKFSDSPNVKIVQHNLETKSLNQNVITKSPELIVSFETLEHLDNPEKNIKEFYDILSDNGYLILSVPNENFESVDELGNPKAHFHKTLLAKEIIEEYLENNGFQIVEKYGQSQLNKLMKRENKLLKKRRIKEKLSDVDILQERKNIYNAAYLFAYPDKDDIENSYSRIFIARKMEK